MAQLHFYVPDEIAQAIQERAQQAHVPVSRFLAELVKREVENEWPEGYFETISGQWQGNPSSRDPDSKFEVRSDLQS
jgi:hypothetical protein